MLHSTNPLQNYKVGHTDPQVVGEKSTENPDTGGCVHGATSYQADTSHCITSQAGEAQFPWASHLPTSVILMSFFKQFYFITVLSSSHCGCFTICE